MKILDVFVILLLHPYRKLIILFLNWLQYVEKLKNLYFSVDDVELYVALALEKPLDGTLGEVGACIVGAQFHHYKCADRLWYEFESAKFSIGKWKSWKNINGLFEKVH